MPEREVESPANLKRDIFALVGGIREVAAVGVGDR